MTGAQEHTLSLLLALLQWLQEQLFPFLSLIFKQATTKCEVRLCHTDLVAHRGAVQYMSSDHQFTDVCLENISTWTGIKLFFFNPAN